VQLVPYFLAKHELTQAQWRALEWGAEPSQYKAGRSYGERAIGARNPVEHVSWLDCDRILRRHGLVLPTEAQWEHACRGGTTWPWYAGPEARALAGHANLGDRWAARFNPSWLKERWLDDGHYVHAPAGSYAANPFGLHDLAGNVAEWCRDWFGGYDLPAREGDGLRLVHGFTDTRILRGGAFDYAAEACRASRRDAWPPDTRSAAIGVRAARALAAGR
jgi:formylglycine-generating enzyme required for sulfatase activity